MATFIEEVAARLYEKYGDKIVICGGFDMDGELSDVNCTEERYKELVRETVDKYTKYGMYVFEQKSKTLFMGTPQVLAGMFFRMPAFILSHNFARSILSSGLRAIFSI